MSETTLQEHIIYALAALVFLAAAGASGIIMYRGENPPESFVLVVGYGLAYIRDFLRDRQVQRTVAEQHDQTRAVIHNDLPQLIKEDETRDGNAG